MAGTKRLVIILISAMLAAYAPISQKGAVCEAPAVKTSAGEKGTAGVDETDQQAEYKLSIKKEGKKLTLKKDAEAEIVRMMEERLDTLYPGTMCYCYTPPIETYEKTGVVVEVRYSDGKELSVGKQSRLVYTIVLAAENNDKDALFDYNCDDGLAGTLVSKNGEFYQKIFSYLTSEYIISEEPLDFTAPKTNIKNGKTYKSGKKITFSDEGSGMKSAKLEGKKIKNGHVVKKKGNHKLVLTDKAGNKKTVNFTII